MEMDASCVSRIVPVIRNLFPRGCRSYGAKACYQNSPSIQTRVVKPGLRKQMIASEVMDSFNSHQLVTVFHYNDVTCQEWKKFRNKLSKYEIKLKVIPVRLSARVLEGTKYKHVTPLLKGCSAIAFSKDSQAVSHLVSITKSETKLHMLGGIVDDQIFTPQGLEEAAKLPSLLTQHMVLSRTLTMLQSSLSSSLVRNQQNFCSLIDRIPNQ